MSLNIIVRGRGEPLVFFHGWGFDHGIWLRLAELLENKYTLYLLDLPGFGLSERMSWSVFKQALLSSLPKACVFIGWSMGGLFATRLAIEAPEHVSVLLNVASSPRFIKEKNWPGVDKTLFDTFLANTITNPQQTLQRFVNLQLRDKINTYSIDTAPTLTSLQAGLQILADWDLRDSLKEVHQPAYFLFGGLDTIVPQKTMLVLRECWPQFTYVLFKKAAHIPFLSHPKEFVSLLDEILDAKK